MAERKHLFDPGPRTPVVPVTNVEIDGLYGRLSYPLEVGPRYPRESVASAGPIITVNEERLTLLYGPNGSGKTTILRLIFHALSPADNRGHRTALFSTAFRRLEIRLADGTRVAYHRRDDDPIGRYQAEIQRPGDDPIVWDYEDPRGRAVWREPEGPTLVGAGTLYFSSESQESRFISALQALAVNPVLLGDSRAITSDTLEREDPSSRLAQRHFDVDELVRASRDLDIQAALQLVSRYLTQLSLSGAQQGAQRVDAVYLDVLAAITATAGHVDQPQPDPLPALTARVAHVGERAHEFHRYGLLPEFPAGALIQALTNAPADQAAVLSRILTPYLEGMQARMDALEPGMRAVASFIDALNSFLQLKRVEFRLGAGGVRIIDRESGEPLDPSVLSSGEKQIVLLFSDITALQDDTRLFLIDEPELSLNPEWQRSLIPRLLEVTELSGMQLIAATHSTEIMVRYRDRIRRLDA